MNETPSKTYSRRLFWRFLDGSRALFLLSMTAAALSALADMLSPQIVRLAVDNVLGGKETGLSPLMARFAARLGGLEYLRGHIGVLALALLAVALVRVLTLYAFRVSNTAAAERLTKTMRDTLFLHIERLPFAWHMRHHTGDIIQRCTSDIDTLKGFISEQMTSIFRIVVLLVLALVFMGGMDGLLTLVALAPVPVILFYSFRFHRKIGAAFLACDENEGKLSSIAQENLTGVRVVRAFGRERQERDRFFKQNRYYTGLWLKLARPMSQYWSSADVLSGTQILLIVVFGSVFCLRGRMTAGEFIAFLSYAAMLTWPVRMLGRMIAEMSKAGVSSDRIAAIMQAEEEKETGRALHADMDGDIAFEHVSFAYENGPEVLHDLSFTMKAGTTLGILGGTGSGKSTMMLLLDKLYALPEDGGRITIGGVDIRDIETRWLREHIGMVLQEPYLFSRSLSDNILIAADESFAGNGGTGKAELIRDASRTAALTETIERFPSGLDTFVGERGVTLSGGQKQRTAIAQMLARRCPVMIFDDSLSAVDAETDARIRRALTKDTEGATVILIAHRIATLMHADRIIVLSGGEVREAGTHAELLARGGIYSEIFALQLGAGEEGTHADGKT